MAKPMSDVPFDGVFWPLSRVSDPLNPSASEAPPIVAADGRCEAAARPSAVR